MFSRQRCIKHKTRCHYQNFFLFCLKMFVLTMFRRLEKLKIQTYTWLIYLKGHYAKQCISNLLFISFVIKQFTDIWHSYKTCLSLNVTCIFVVFSILIETITSWYKNLYIVRFLCGCNGMKCLLILAGKTDFLICNSNILFAVMEF